MNGDALHVYVAGPISRDPLGGTRSAILAANELVDHGIAPYVPHLCVLWEMLAPRDYISWLGLGIVWLRKCDALLRLPGDSRGSDLEVAEAERLGLPVFHRVSDVIEWAKTREAA